MKVIFEIPTEDFNAIQLHSAEELGIDFAQEVFDRIVVSEEIIDRDFSAIKEALNILRENNMYGVVNIFTDPDADYIFFSCLGADKFKEALCDAVMSGMRINSKQRRM